MERIFVHPCGNTCITSLGKTSPWLWKFLWQTCSSYPQPFPNVLLLCSAATGRCTAQVTEMSLLFCHAVPSANTCFFVQWFLFNRSLPRSASSLKNLFWFLSFYLNISPLLELCAFYSYGIYHSLSFSSQTTQCPKTTLSHISLTPLPLCLFFHNICSGNSVTLCLLSK